MIRNFHIQRPRKPIPVPQWSLSLVLHALRAAPFEPIGSSSLENLTLKAVFLLALATSKRVSELHALDVREGHLIWGTNQVTLRPHPLFLAKNQVLDSVANPIVVKALTEIVGPERGERLNCPVRALKWYFDRTKERRGNNTRLFLPLSENQSDCSKRDIAKWIVQAIRAAYNLSPVATRDFNRVTAHEVRAISTSLGLWAGVSVQKVIEAGTWRSNNSFTSFYLRDMAQEANNLASLGPISVCQTLVTTRK